MKWPLFSRKSFGEVENAALNKWLKAVFGMQLHSGIATPMTDDPTAYIKQGYSGNSDVYSIINRMVRMATQARMALWTLDNKGKWVEVTDHELVKFTKRMNPYESFREFQEAYIIYMSSIGNSYWYTPTLTSGVNKGKTNEIYSMPANNVEVLAGSSWMAPVGGYDLTTNVSVKYLPEEVYHSKYFNPLFGELGSLYGQSPLKAAARTVSKQNEAETTELKQFQQQAPPYMLYKDTTDFISGLTDQQRREIQDLFKDYAKKVKSGHPLVLPDKFGMIRIGVSPVDLGILQSSQEGRRALCNIFGLPSELFNDKEASTYNNIREAKKDAWNNCLKPMLDNMADGLTNKLIYTVPEYIGKGLFFAYDYSQIPELQQDYAVMVQWMKEAGYSRNEMREATGARPIDNPLMDEPWFNMGESPLSAMSTTDVLPLKNFGDYGSDRSR